MGSGPVMDPKLLQLYKTAGTWRCLREVYRSIGIRGLYSGFGLHMGELNVLSGRTLLTESSPRYLRNRRLLGVVREPEAGYELVVGHRAVRLRCGRACWRSLWLSVVHRRKHHRRRSWRSCAYTNTQAYPLDTVKNIYQRNCLHMSEEGKKHLVRQAINFFAKSSFNGKISWISLSSPVSSDVIC
jgi:hypothetical protein